MAKTTPTMTIGNYTVTLHPELGSGMFGTVFRAKSVVGNLAAVKKILFRENDGHQNDYMMKMAFQEIKSTQSTQKGHKNIIKFLEYHMDEHAYWLIMEFCDLGDLHRYLKERKPELATKVDILHQCACAIEFMHSCKPPVVHRDIKTKNFVLKSENGAHIVKATDFGLAKLVNEDRHKLVSMYMTSFGGTYDYMAPEFFFDYVRYKSSIDIFSLGLVFLVVLQYGPGSPDTDLIPQTVGMRKQMSKLSVGNEMKVALDNKKQIPDIVKLNASDVTPVKELKQLITKMVVYEPKSRISITDIKSCLDSLVGTQTTDVGAIPRHESKYVDSESDIEGDDSIGSDQPGYKLVTDLIALSGGIESIYGQTSLCNISDNVKSAKFKRYDTVVINKTVSEIKSLQKGYGGYNPDLENCFGMKGMVTAVKENVIGVQFENGLSFSLNSAILALDVSTDSVIESGDYVKVQQDRNTVERIQKQPGNGGWHEEMSQILGEAGIVRCVRGQKVKVEHREKDKNYVWHQDALILKSKGEELLVHLMQQL